MSLEAALHLAAMGFYVFPVVPNGTEPLVKGWQEKASCDPDRVRALFKKYPNANIGIYTGRFSRDQALIAIDVDVKDGKPGRDSLLKLELEGKDLPLTRTQVTPSGGAHLIYVHNAAVKQGVNVLGPGLDIRSRGGYLVAAPSTTPRGQYRIGRNGPPLPAPDWLWRELQARELQAVSEPIQPPSAIDENAAIARAVAFLANLPEVQQGQRNHALYQAVCRIKELGVSQVNALPLVLEYFKAAPPLPEHEVETTVDSAYRHSENAQGSAAPEAHFNALPPNTADTTLHPFDELNKSFAFVVSGGKHHILWETTNAKGNKVVEHLQESAFHAMLAHRTFGEGKRAQPLTEAWMNSDRRRSYDGIVFAPGQDTPPRFYNLWRGFAFQPADTGDSEAVRMFLEHARLNVCGNDIDQYNWLISWFAQMIQYPAIKPQVATVFRGSKGVGKNALLDHIAALLGQHCVQASSPRYLVGRFNSHMEATLLLVLNEAFWSGDKAAEGVLKDVITGRSHLIEHKGKEVVTRDNLMRISIIGNEFWLVPATYDERRFMVFDVGDGRKGDASFFIKMRQLFEKGEYSNLLRFLLDWPISNISKALNTRALVDQKREGLECVEQWWLDSINTGLPIGTLQGEWPKELVAEQVRRALVNYVRERNIRSRVPDVHGIGRRLAQVCPGIKQVRRTLLENGARISHCVYILPPVDDCKTQFAEYLGCTIGEL